MHLCAGNVHSGGVKTMLDLSSVVHLQNVVSTKLDVVGQLAVLKEVHHKRYLPYRPTCHQTITLLTACLQKKYKKST